MAKLSPASGSQAKGEVAFMEEGSGVRVKGRISGLKPGEHGFHVHEKGDCSAADASSAGDHFNPTGQSHGAPTGASHHVGDMGNITANAEGVAEVDKLFPFLALSGTNSIVGRAIVVHSDPDDLSSQPSGNAGGRVACGVIEMQ